MLRWIPRSYFRDHHVRLERRTRSDDFSWCLHWLILWFPGSKWLEHNVIILRKDLTGQREKLFLKPIDIIKDFTRDHDTAAKILLKKLRLNSSIFPVFISSPVLWTLVAKGASIILKGRDKHRLHWLGPFPNWDVVTLLIFLG